LRQLCMTQCEALRLLGSPEVRNAILLNEIGVLIHDFANLSAEFVSGHDTFPPHLVLHRLIRGKDPYLGHDVSPRSAILLALRDCTLSEGERIIADLVGAEISATEDEERPLSDRYSANLEAALHRVQGLVSPDYREAWERVALLARGVLADLTWQTEEEERVAAREPPFVAARGLVDGLDELPFVANLVEMGGRTWHPESLLPPEVGLFRAIHEQQEIGGEPGACCPEERLSAVRQIYCEVLANQFLEINNIRKDGPGDLGSWFWKSRLYARSEEGISLLNAFDRGSSLEGEQREVVTWLGVRSITRWAYAKIALGISGDGKRIDLWDHCWALCGPYKSVTAQALIDGQWPEGDQVSWCTLRIGLRRSDPGTLDSIKGLIEVEYPLGNELRRTAKGIHFTFPTLKDEIAVPLLEGLTEEIDRLGGKDPHPELTLAPSPGNDWDAPPIQAAATRV
jgi:hypothetical protein